MNRNNDKFRILYLIIVGRPKFRRSRTIFNTEQLEVLEQHFQRHKYPDVKHRKKISEEIGLPEERIQIWFQNRRAKDKRQMEQQVKLQKLVDEAIGGTQETNRTHNNIETGKYDKKILRVCCVFSLKKKRYSLQFLVQLATHFYF